MQYIHREQQEYINRKPESEQKQGEAGSANDEFWWCDSGGSGLCVASTEDAKRAEESLREGARKIGSIIIAGESLAIEQLEKLFDKLEQINPKFASHLKENAAIIADYINAASEYAASKIPDSIKSAYEAFLAGTTLEERKFLEYATAGAAAKGFKAFTKASGPNKGHKDFSFKDGDKHPSTPVGHKEKEIFVAGSNNARTSINGREYSGHALDRMQERGLTPSMIEHVIERGIQSSSRIQGRIIHYDPINKVTVVTENSNVITVMWGGLKK